MKKFTVKKVVTSVEDTLNKALIKLVTLKDDNRGEQLTTTIFLAVVAVVLVSVVFFPQIREMLTGAFNNADGKMDEIWNYKG